MLHLSWPQVIYHVGARIVESARIFAGRQVKTRSVIFDYAGKVYFDSERSRIDRFGVG